MERGKKASIRDQWGIIFVAIFLASALRINAAPTGEINLVKDEKTSYQILISAQAHPTEAFAAEELQKYLKKITGAELEILTNAEGTSAKWLIFVGATKHCEAIKAQLQQESGGKDAFVIKTEGKDFILVGSNPRSTLYAVYAFLEELGCRWYTPGEDGENIPTMDVVKIDAVEKKEIAGLNTRSIWIELSDKNTFPKEAFYLFVDWAAKNRLNHISVDACWDYPLNLGDTQYLNEVKKRGFTIGLGTHCFWWLESQAAHIPWNNAMMAKTEYFAKVNGKRTMFKEQFCYSNPATIDFLKLRLKKFIRAYPHVDEVHFWIADTPAKPCECEGCKKYTFTDWYVYGVNALAKELHLLAPEKKLLFIAYNTDQTLPAPKQIFPDSSLGNIVLGFHSATLGGKDFVRFPGSYFEKYMDDWRKVYPGPIRPFHYYCAALASWTRYFSNFASEVMAENAKAFAVRKVEGEMEAMTVPRFWPSGVNLFLLGKVFWNAGLDIEQEKTGYYEGYYSCEAASIRKIFDRLEGLKTVVAGRVANTIETASLEDLDEVLAMGKEVESLYKASSSDPKLTARINRVMIYMKYLKKGILGKKYAAEKEYEKIIGEEQSFQELVEKNKALLCGYVPILDLIQESDKNIAMSESKRPPVGQSTAGVYAPNWKGFICNWLICGPFSSPSKGDKGTDNYAVVGWGEDYFQDTGGEVKIEPKADRIANADFSATKLTLETGKRMQWYPYQCNGNNVDYTKVFDPKEYVAGYAFCYIESDQDREVKVGIGSDDGYKLWINHQLVGEKNVFRGTTEDSEVYKVRLCKGLNAVLVKVVTDIGGHSFCLRFLDKNQNPISKELKVKTIR